ncbi:DUF4421 family protein [Flavobacterium sp. 5]|uniref:DUF4421 family protein n=1 Tax=Flavobacterium sp. 5 TaxID=2035199 RepID=UPI000C2BD4C5|nr:DUF4421 family protein [Flavobacterium sp. 5]PKB16944.1 uncharacterized protein DUF4421 [Flavobacterium sp. 5]
MKTTRVFYTQQINQYLLKSVVFFAVLFLCNGTVFSQKKERDTSKFVFYPDKILIRANLSTQTDAQILEDKNGSNLDLETNNSYKVFLSVDYKFIGFSYGFYPQFIGGNKDEDKKGKSKFSEYNFRFFLGKWLQTVDYSRVKGYYIENTQDFSTDWQPDIDPYIQFPDLKIIKYGMSTSYIFNPNFSLKSITSFTEWQKESAGSFIPTLIYDYKRTSLDATILNAEQNEYDVSLGTGYFYNFIIHKRFYIAPNLTTAIGVKFMNSKTNESGIQEKEQDNYFLTTLNGGLKMGYNSDRILLGLSLHFNTSFYNESKNQIVSSDGSFGLLYFGYRFDTPKFISKPVNKIDDKLNFKK